MCLRSFVSFCMRQTSNVLFFSRGVCVCVCVCVYMALCKVGNAHGGSGEPVACDFYLLASAILYTK